MKLKSYPAYKDSGVPWIGEIPVGWETRPIKVSFDIQLGKMLQPEPSAEATHELEYLRAANVQWGEIKTDDIKTMFMSTLEAQKYGLDVGDLLILEGGDIGRAALIEESTAHLKIQNSLHRVRAITGDTQFLYYVMQHIKGSGILDVLCNKATIQHLTGDKLASLCIPIPPIEQVGIAAFLNYETARIDELVREQERLLEELGLKRIGTINNATRALPHLDASNLPRGWISIPLKSALSSIEQGWSPQCDNRPAVEGEWGVLKVGCVNGDNFNPHENKVLPDVLLPITRYALRRDDVLVSRANTRDLVGSAARVDADYPRLLLCDKLYRLRCDMTLLLPGYLVLLLGSPLARAAIEMAASGASASMVNISQSTIKNLRVPVPPVEEQVKILEHLATELAQIDALTEEVRANIEDMRLHRSALITAAVTGKIDVRDAE